MNFPIMNPSIPNDEVVSTLLAVQQPNLLGAEFAVYFKPLVLQLDD
jgi:hypothetical protein